MNKEKLFIFSSVLHKLSLWCSLKLMHMDQVGPEEEGKAHYCLTSTVMLSLTTNDDSSGTFSLSGSIRRQVPICDSRYIWFFFLLLRKKTDLFHETILKKNLDFVVLWVPFSCRGYISFSLLLPLTVLFVDHFLLNFCGKRTGWSKCKAFRLFFSLGEYHLVIVVLRHV